MGNARDKALSCTPLPVKLSQTFHLRAAWPSLRTAWGRSRRCVFRQDPHGTETQTHGWRVRIGSAAASPERCHQSLVTFCLQQKTFILTTSTGLRNPGVGNWTPQSQAGNSSPPPVTSPSHAWGSRDYLRMLCSPLPRAALLPPGPPPRFGYDLDLGLGLSRAAPARPHSAPAATHRPQTARLSNATRRVKFARGGKRRKRRRWEREGRAGSSQKTPARRGGGTGARSRGSLTPVGRGP
jgi:hypothetical protein